MCPEVLWPGRGPEGSTLILPVGVAPSTAEPWATLDPPPGGVVVDSGGEDHGRVTAILARAVRS